MPDYEIQQLMTRLEYYRRLSSKEAPCMAYFYTRSIIRYMCRLVFSIGWGKIKQEDKTGKASIFVYDNLLRSPTETRSKDSIEPGTFGFVLKTISTNVSKYQEVHKECDILYELGKVRNYNSHEINTINFEVFYADSAKVFDQFRKYIGNKICSYIIPVEFLGRNEIRCEKLEVNSIYPEEIILPSKCLEWQKEGDHLFYSVFDPDLRETKYYCLSPFIEVPSIIHNERPHFRVFNRVKDNGYGNAYDVLYYDDVVPSELKIVESEYGEVLDADFKKSTERFNRSVFFPVNYGSDELIWIPSAHNDVYINISSYPSYRSIIHNEYKYCPEICKIRNNVISFCKDKNRPIAFITGNGGVGKTALVLSILNEFFSTKTTYGFTNLIFVSAKKIYYEPNYTNYYIKHVEEETDVHNYDEFILKIAKLLNIDSHAKSIGEIADSIILKMNSEIDIGDANKRFLLIIDDLDSLGAHDQRLISDFVYRLDSHVFKSIITTRDIINISPISFRMNDLSEDESITFSKWYVENKLNIQSWNNWSRRKKAESIVLKCSEGNPLNIEVLLTLVKSGYEHEFTIPMTQLERSEYLYNTITNMLTKEERIIFEICRNLYLGIPDDLKTQDMMISVPEYLSAGCEITQEVFRKSFEKLLDLKLFLRSNNKLQFKPYSSFILREKVIPSENDILPNMYSLFWDEIKNNYSEWLSFQDVERKIYNSIINIQNKRKFDNIIARRILETITHSPYINNDLSEEINTWLKQHSITAPDSQNETLLRLIQDIEKKWSDYKLLVDEMKNDNTLIITINDEIRDLKKLLRNSQNLDVKRRLNIIGNEINEYF